MILTETVHIFRMFYTYKHDSIFFTAGGKVKNAQNYRQIDAQSKAEGIKPVIYGVPLLPAEVGILYFFAPGRKSGNLD